MGELYKNFARTPSPEIESAKGEVGVIFRGLQNM